LEHIENIFERGLEQTEADWKLIKAYRKRLDLLEWVQHVENE